MKKKICIAIDGPVIELHDNESLVGVHFLIQRPTLGRVLFTGWYGVFITGRNVTVADCLFERI